MKLLRCHIENFGTLSDFDYSFGDGLTVIKEANGFGKSTFAAFIKAMFYGFPARGARDAVSNERKRYDPWQGGTYGGFLEFEHEGTAYRIARTFGRSLKGDTFRLYDLTARSESRDFSEKIGEELFRLDADAFTRSTYLTQTTSAPSSGGAATASIRAKLSNLVDDTDDLNNYDTAIAKLQNKRRRFKAYRGSGGTIFDAEAQCRTLEQMIDTAEAKTDRFTEVMEKIETLNDDLSAKREQAEALREKYRRSSDRKAVLTQKKLLNELQGDVNKAKDYLSGLDAQYPKGYPTQEEIAAQRGNLHLSRQEWEHMKENALSEEERRTLEAGRGLYEDTERVEEDISRCGRDCTELAKVTAALTAQLLPAERDRLAELEKQFEAGAPSRQQLDEWAALSDAIVKNTLLLEQTMLPVEDAETFARLEPMFREGIPSEALLTTCGEKLQKIRQLQTEKQHYCLTEEEEAEYQGLARRFAAGLPTPEQVEDQQKNCRRITELTGKKNTQTTLVQETAAERPTSKAPLLCGIFGGLLILGGIACAAFELLPGIILLTVGFLSVLAAFGLHTNQMVAGQSRAVSTITASAISDEENQELYDLQHGVNDFLLSYYSDAVDPEAKLMQLMLSIDRFTKLKAERDANESLRQRADAQLAQTEKQCRRFFFHFYPDAAYHEGFLPALRQDSADFVRIQKQKVSVEERRAALAEQMRADSGKLRRQLAVYAPEATYGEPKKVLQDLKAAAADYRSLKERREQLQRGNAASRQRADELTEALQSTLARYGVYRAQLPFETCLDELRARLAAFTEISRKAARYYEAEKKYRQARQALEAFLFRYALSGAEEEDLIEWADDDTKDRGKKQSELAEAEKKLKAFLAENPGVEALVLPEEELPEPEVFKNAEEHLQSEIKEQEEERNELRQERDTLLQELEQIPAWKDEREHLLKQKREDEQSLRLVEAAIGFLESAKSSLAESYVGRVEAGFSRYASALLRDELGPVSVDRDLRLFVDEKGDRREVGCFSAGMADSIMLCMRLSLIDALFAEEKPFLILDDPFVNLDDDHTARALQMLDKIAETHQIVYLVCNSSRVGPQ